MARSKRESVVTIDDLRRFAVARSLFAPTTLQGALDRFGFVQADPIRAPARAQDLTLRHRVRNYSAGDLERSFPTLDVEEDYFLNYGFLPRSVQALMIALPMNIAVKSAVTHRFTRNPITTTMTAFPMLL